MKHLSDALPEEASSDFNSAARVRIRFSGLEAVQFAIVKDITQFAEGPRTSLRSAKKSGGHPTKHSLEGRTIMTTSAFCFQYLWMLLHTSLDDVDNLILLRLVISNSV